jgi:hypothetical protein
MESDLHFFHLRSRGFSKLIDVVVKELYLMQSGNRADASRAQPGLKLAPGPGGNY